MHEPATWIARRVGAIGPRRHDIIGALRREFLGRSTASVADNSLGLSAEELGAMATAFDFAGLAATFPSRGDVQRLRQIAWFGSALGDVACAERCERDEDVLLDAAIFNLAVALFDTAVDDQPSLLPALTNTLNPTVLRSVLVGDPTEKATPLGDQRGIEGLQSLFVHVLRRARGRFLGMHVKLASLDAFVRLMFDSETGDRASRARAKTLPITFINALATPTVFPSRLSASLSTFLALYDDWQDLGHDVVDRRANAFVQLVDGEGWDAWSYWPRAALGLCWPRRIAVRLADTARQLLSAAEASGPLAQSKTLTLIDWLLGPS
jgi:hypothetical protein